MAGTARRVDSRSEKKLQEGRKVEAKERKQSYEEGSAVRRIEPLQREEPSSPREEAVDANARGRVSGSRTREIRIRGGYVFFLALICVFTMTLCVRYLQKKAELTRQNEIIAAKESQLNKLKADNDAYYAQVLASLTLEDVKEAALNRLGLHYATESQIQYYNAAENSYVRQYQNLSDSK